MHEFQYDYLKPKHREKAKLGEKQKIFTQTLQKMLEQDLIPQIMNQKDHYLEEKVKKLFD